MPVPGWELRLWRRRSERLELVPVGEERSMPGRLLQGLAWYLAVPGHAASYSGDLLRLLTWESLWTCDMFLTTPSSLWFLDERSRCLL